MKFSVMNSFFIITRRYYGQKQKYEIRWCCELCQHTGFRKSEAHFARSKGSRCTDLKEEIAKKRGNSSFLPINELSPHLFYNNKRSYFITAQYNVYAAAYGTCVHQLHRGIQNKASVFQDCHVIFLFRMLCLYHKAP